MKRQAKALLLTAVAAAVLSPAVHAKSWVEQNPSHQRVATSVVKDDIIVMRTDSPFKEVRVADASIADVVVLTNQSFHVLGKKGGKTNVMLYDAENTLIDIIDISVDFDLNALKKSLFEAFPNQKIGVKSMAGGVYISGDVATQNAYAQAEKIAQAYAPGRITNGLQVRDSHQVMLEVRFVEASRDAVKELGIGLLTQRAGDFAFQAGSGLMSGSQPSLSGVLLGGAGSAALDVSIDALEEQGVIRTLAEPNLVSMSGDTASFLAGGEFPIPVAADDGQVAIEFRQFGVGLSFTPTVRGDGVINLEVSPEVSQIDWTNSIRLSGIEIPALRVRRADTTVELRNSQSFAIAGLLQNNQARSKAQAPWLGDIPILGALFRSSRYQNFETELVIIVTPRLVQPAPDISDLATPLDGLSAPSEGDLFLNGNIDGKRSQSSQTTQTTQPQQPTTAPSRQGKLAATYGHTI